MASSDAAADLLGALRGWPVDNSDTSAVYAAVMADHFQGCEPVISEEDLENFETCDVCGKKMFMPSIMQPCNHYVCYNCAPRYSQDMKCPICCDPCDGAGLDMDVALKTHSVPVKCPFCGEEMSLDLFKTHIDLCEKFERPCRNAKQGCEFKGDDQALIEHEENCPYNEVKCKHCLATMFQKDLEAHVDVCPELCAVCPNGCGCTTITEQILTKKERPERDTPERETDEENAGNSSFELETRERPMRKTDIPEHLKVCPYREIRCPVPGCNEKVRLCDEKKHLVAPEFIKKHIMLLTNMKDTLAVDYEMAEDASSFDFKEKMSVEGMQERMHQMEVYVASLSAKVSNVISTLNKILADDYVYVDGDDETKVQVNREEISALLNDLMEHGLLKGGISAREENSIELDGEDKPQSTADYIAHAKVLMAKISSLTRTADIIRAFVLGQHAEIIERFSVIDDLVEDGMAKVRIIDNEKNEECGKGYGNKGRKQDEILSDTVADVAELGTIFHGKTVLSTKSVQPTEAERFIDLRIGCILLEQIAQLDTIEQTEEGTNEVIEVIDEHLREMSKVVKAITEEAREKEKNIQEYLENRLSAVEHDAQNALKEYISRAEMWARDCNQALDVASSIRKKGVSIKNVVEQTHMKFEEEKERVISMLKEVQELEKTALDYERTERKMEELWNKGDRLIYTPCLKTSSFKLVRQDYDKYKLEFTLRNIEGKELDKLGAEDVMRLLDFGGASTEVVGEEIFVYSTEPVKVTKSAAL